LGVSPLMNVDTRTVLPPDGMLLAGVVFPYDVLVPYWNCHSVANLAVWIEPLTVAVLRPTPVAAVVVGVAVAVAARADPAMSPPITALSNPMTAKRRILMFILLLRG
jgi:hypothetical protein